MTKKTKLQQQFDLAKKKSLAIRAVEFADKVDRGVSHGALMVGWEAGYRACLTDCRAALFSGDLFNLLRPRKR